MAYERKRDSSKADKDYNYVIINENDDECDSDSSDVFLNGPKKKNSVQYSQRVQVLLCIILILAVILLIFVVYNFISFIFAFQNAMQLFGQKIPQICQTARMLNSNVAKGLKFCDNVTVAFPTMANSST